jgi:coatomer subunit delta
MELQNKEAEAKEELKRRAKQLEIQRREQQRRAGSNPGLQSPSYLNSGYSSIPRFEIPTPAINNSRSASPAPSSLRPPAFKGSGMKLGSKKKTGADLADLLGGDVAASEEPLLPPTTPSVPEPVVEKVVNLPAVVQERLVHSRRMLTIRRILTRNVIAFMYKFGNISLYLSCVKVVSSHLNLKAILI